MTRPFHRTAPWATVRGMSEYVEFEGTPGIFLKTSDDAYGLVPVGVADESLRRIKASLGDSLGVVRDVADAALKQISALAKPPSEAVVEFSVELSASGHFVVASGAAKSTFNISLTWRTER